MSILRLRPAARCRTLKPAILTAPFSAALLAIFSVVAHAQAPLFTEGFDSNALEDAGQTTADWNTGSSRLQLQGSGPDASRLTGATFDASSTPIALPGDFRSQGIALGDMDGDGDLDLVEMTGDLSESNHVWLNNGAGGVVVGYSTPEQDSSRDVAIGDVDRDGDLDFVVANWTESPTRVYLNDGTGTGFVMQPVTTRAFPSDAVALADLDGDGFLDVILANRGTTGALNVVMLNTGDPLVPFGPNGAQDIAFDPGSRLMSKRALTGDLDLDGDIDVVFTNEGDDNEFSRVYMNTRPCGSAVCLVGSDIGAPTDDNRNTKGGALGDLDGDGLLDLVVANKDDSVASQIYFNQNEGPNANPFTAAAVDFQAPVAGSGPARIALGDMDRDGDLDMVVGTEGLAFRNRLYTNNGSGTFAMVEIGPDPTNKFASDVEIGDVDGDDQLDIIVGNRLTGSQSLPNTLFVNAGMAGGAAALQLSGVATSLQVLGSGVNTVRLTANTASVGPSFHNQVDFWVSGNGGADWVTVATDGRPVLLPSATNDLRWRAFLHSSSPFNAGALRVNDLTISDNTIPTALGLADVTVTEGDPVTNLPIEAGDGFADADNDPLFFSISGLPEGTGLSIDPTDGDIEGTPRNADASAPQPIVVTITATDGSALVSDTFELTVTNDNDAPEFTSTPPNEIPGVPPVSPAPIGAPWVYNITTDDRDPPGSPGNMRAITIAALPAWLTTFVDNGDGTAVLSGTPTEADSGTYAISLTVTDMGNPPLSATQDFEILVSGPPQFTSAPVTDVTEGNPYVYDVLAEDPNVGQTATLTLTATVLPAWLQFVDNGGGMGSLTGTPTTAEIGDHPVELEAQDSDGLTAIQSFTVTVARVNVDPAFSSTPVTAATVGQAYQYQITTSDADGDPVAVTAPTLPSWLSLADNGDGTAVLSGTPTSGVVGANAVTLTAADPLGGVAMQQFTITVAAAPAPAPSPAPSGGGGGGGPMGLTDLLMLLILASVAAVDRRRRRVGVTNA